MDHRRDARFSGNQTVWLTIYGKVDARLPARLRNVAARGIGLEVDQPVGAGNALKIEVSDCMLLGEAIYCRAEGSHFYVGVELDQALHSLMALGQSLQEFAASRSGSEQTYTLQETGSENQQKSH